MFSALKKVISLLVTLTLFFTLIPCAFAADYSCCLPVAFQLNVNGSPVAIHAYDVSYDGNTYLSLSDLSAALSGTEKQFQFLYSYTNADGEIFSLTTGLPSASGDFSTLYGFSGQEDSVWLECKRNRIFQDGNERKYYTYRSNNDLYLSLTDAQFLLNLHLASVSEHCYAVSTADPLQIDLEELSDKESFHFLNGVLLADADTDEILYQHYKNTLAPIASTTKLMTYLVLMEGVQAGEITSNDYVTISSNAEKLSKSADGLIEMTAGEVIPFQELMQGMLLASSNECALALAEHLCGTEEAFVARMTEKAAQMKLNSAHFTNCNGLPYYSTGSFPSKQQNRMSAYDMFLLVKEILNEFPQITEITSLQYCYLPNLDYTTANSNPLVFNLNGTTGLKTGSTNKAGYCEVATLPITCGTETHTIVLVLFGAETASERGQFSELLLRYAQQYYAQNGFAAS